MIIFSRKEAFLIFPEMETPKILFTFLKTEALTKFQETKTEISYISGNFLYFRKKLSEFEKLKNSTLKKFLIYLLIRSYTLLLGSKKIYIKRNINKTNSIKHWC